MNEETYGVVHVPFQKLISRVMDTTTSCTTSCVPICFNVMYTCQKMDVQWVNGLQMKEFCFLHLTIIFYLICTCFRSFMCAIIIKWANSDKGLNHKWVIFLTFWLFHKKEFLKGFFCNLFLKIVTIPLINYITCVNFFWINMKVLKV
jgi:hypothetical protein